MAEKLAIQIALDGGAEIERQLADIGKAGQQAFANISKSAEQVGGFKNLKPEDVTAKLQEMGVTGVDAIDKIQKAVQSAKNLETVVQGITSVQTGLKALAAALPVIGVAAVAAFTAAAKATIGFAAEIGKASEQAAKLGLSFEQFDKLRATMESAGVSANAISQGIGKIAQATEQAGVDKVTKAIKELQDAATRGFGPQGTQQLQILQEAANGIGPAADKARDALKQMGIEPAASLQLLVDRLGKVQGLVAFLGQVQTGGAPASLKEFIAAFGQTAGLEAFLRQLEAMPNAVQRNKLAMDQLGISADRLQQILERLRSGQPLTGLISPQDVEKANALNGAIERLDAAWRRFGSTALGPILTTSINAVTNALQALQNLINNFSWGTVVNGVLALGNALKNLTIPGMVSVLLQTILGKAEQATQAVQGTNQVLAQTGPAAQQAAAGFQIVPNPFTGMPEAIRTTNQALQQVGPTAQQAGQQTAQAAQQGTSAWQTLPAAVNKSIEQVKSFASAIASITWDTISNLGVQAWNALTSAIQSAIDKLLKFIGLRPSGAPSGEGAPGKARGGLLGGRGTGTSDSNLAWVSRGEHIMPANVVRQPGVLAFLETLRRGGGIPGFAEGGFIRGVAESDSRLGEEISNWIVKIAEANNTARTALQGVVNSINTLADAFTTSLFTVVTDMINKLNVLAAAGMASGGLLGGRGSGTSDSNLAWVSRGEYITPARAVGQPGVLAFLEALRRSGGNLRAVLDGMGRFALGGMVPRALPAFAGGGLAGGMSNVTIQFPGLPAISGLRASSDVVDQLHKAAALAQVRSGGRKPSRYS